MAMKSWNIDLYYGIHPLIVAKRRVYELKELLIESGFTIKLLSFSGTDPHPQHRVIWNVTHYTNEYALEELLLKHGDTLLPAKYTEIENGV